MACSTYIKNKILPYLQLPGPVEIDESKISAQRWSHVGRFPKKLNWVFGLVCRRTKIPIICYIKDKFHSTLSDLVRKYVQVGSCVFSDCHPSYVNLQNSTSKLTTYGFYHFWVNHTETFVHRKFSFVYTNHIERIWRSLKSTTSYIKYSTNEDRITEYIHSFMLRQLLKKDQYYLMLLRILRFHYTWHMSKYLDKV